MKTNTEGTALITGASTGIGVIYPDRLARRGYDLILVARDKERLNSVAAQLSQETSRSIRTVAADLTKKVDLARVEQVLRTDESIRVLINNARVGAPAKFLDSEIERLTGMIDLNVSALVRSTYAAVPARRRHHQYRLRSRDRARTSERCLWQHQSVRACVQPFTPKGILRKQDARSNGFTRRNGYRFLADRGNSA